MAKITAGAKSNSEIFGTTYIEFDGGRTEPEPGVKLPGVSPLAKSVDHWKSSQRRWPTSTFQAEVPFTSSWK